MEKEKLIKQLAQRKVYEHFFSNAWEDGWPEDPEEFIAQYYGYENCLELSPSMEVWEPYESYTIDALIQLMAEFQKMLLDFYKEAARIQNIPPLSVKCKETYVEDDNQYWTKDCVYDATNLGDGEYAISTDLGGIGHVGPAYIIDNFDEYFEIVKE